VMGRMDSNCLLSVLQQVVGSVEQMLLTVKSGGSLLSCHVSALARCKCLRCDMPNNL